MPLRIVIVADDLTGAIDTATPFARQGMKVTVALTGKHIERALAEDPDVLAVATGTRHMSDMAARQHLLDLTRTLRRFSPDIFFKKIDSRLKGNIVPEVLGMLEGLQRGHIVLAPAIPEQGRRLHEGHVIGMGVDRPIPLPAFPDNIDVHAPDTADPADLIRVAGHILESPQVLAVGARGLGQALADRLSVGTGHSAPLAFGFPLLIAIGSRDPITIRQVEHLIASEVPVATVIAPNGNVPMDVGSNSYVTLVRCVETGSAEDSEIVAQRFGAGIATLMGGLIPQTLVASGGDTAAAILHAVGIETIQPLGEIDSGLPLSSFNFAGRDLRLITKSGGFGSDECLSEVVRAASVPLRSGH
jgi:uncharacterized protein YgbK (DUF1537 family)